jgi:hypothetical protein
MAKISNTAAYPGIPTLDAADYLIITDAENQLKTKTVLVSEMQDFFGIDTNVAHVVLNEAQVRGMSTTPVTLIAAPGAGKVIDIMSIDTYLDAGTVVFAFANNLEVKIGSSVFGTLSFQSANFATDLVSKIGMVIDTSGSSDSTSRVIDQNTAVTLTSAADSATGNGVMYFNIYYRILTVGTTF